MPDRDPPRGLVLAFCIALGLMLWQLYFGSTKHQFPGPWPKTHIENGVRK